MLQERPGLSEVSVGDGGAETTLDPGHLDTLVSEGSLEDAHSFSHEGLGLRAAALQEAEPPEALQAPGQVGGARAHLAPPRLQCSLQKRLCLAIETKAQVDVAHHVH